jgi:hypothetical protein
LTVRQQLPGPEAKGGGKQARAATTTDDATGLYGVLQAHWREDLALDGPMVGAGEFLVGARPTGNGAALMAGITLSHTDDTVDWLPTVLVAGELPNVGAAKRQ